MINEETKEKNFRLFIKKLEQVGVDTSLFVEESTKKKIENATFTNTNEFGNAYYGSLLEIVLKVLTPYAVRINDLLPEKQRVDKNILVKVCLLHHLAKSVRFVPNDNLWEIEKRHMTYKYNEENPSIRNGLHSLIMATNLGVSFTAEEAEAMTVNDRDSNDEQSKWFSSVMAIIIKQANELTYVEINKKK